MPFRQIIRRIVPRRLIEMYSQLNYNPSVHRFLTSNTTPFYYFLKKRAFHTSRPCYVTKVAASPSNPLSFNSITARMPRNVRAEVEDVLLDYLHCTRSISYTDAEHISKSCPTFIENLLSKVKDDQEIRRSLSRYLRYYPINEFEPFFESLGLHTSEIPPLLSRNLMFLSDEELMLENYHVLCNYGIPRSKIGKIYKDERDIFGYNYGVLASKLRAYEELGLGIPTVVKLVSCCPSLLVGAVNKDFVEVVRKLKDLGIETGWIIGHMSDGLVCNWSRMLDMICFLDKMSCGKKDMGKLIMTYPGFLIEDSGKKAYFLVSMLLKVGLKMDDISVLFLQYPQVLAGKFAKNLWQAVQFLSEIGMGSEDIAKIVRGHTQILGSSSLRKPVTVLSDHDVGPDTLCQIIKEDPLKLISLASRKANVKKVDSERGGHHLEKITFLRSIGYVENSEEMVKALKQFRGRGDQLQERFDCLVNAGLDCHVVANIIRGAPPVLNQSKDVIEMKIQYLVNHLGYPIKSLEGFPTYICYGIEKIKLRFSMYMWHMEKGTAKPTAALSSVLACSDKRFVKYYVGVHPEGPAEWERLKKSSSSI